MSCRLAWGGNGVRKRAEARDVVPQAFEDLVVIGTRACCVTEHLWIEVPVLGQGDAQLDVLGTSVVGVLLQLVHAEAEAVVPLQRARQLLCPLLNIRAPKAALLTNLWVA